MKRKAEKNEGEREAGEKEKKKGEKNVDWHWVSVWVLQTVEKYWVMTSEWWCQTGWGVLSDEW